MRIGVLSNRRAGGSGARVARVLEHLSRDPDIVHVEAATSHDAPDAMRELADAGIDILIVNGGDGTLQHTLTAVLRDGSPFRKVPMIAPIRTGRTSMSALDIGSHRDPMVAVDHLLERVRAGRVEEAVAPHAALRVIVEPDGIDHWGTFFGVGVIYRATLLTHRLFPTGRAQGVFGSSLVTMGLLARALFGAGKNEDGNDILTADTIDVTLDGEGLGAHDYQLVIATTLRRFMMNIKPFWGTGPGGVRFTAVGPGGLRDPRAVARVLRGKAPKNHADGHLYVSRNCDRVDLDLDCGAVLDGEMFDPRQGRRATLLADRRVRFLSTR